MCCCSYHQNTCLNSYHFEVTLSLPGVQRVSSSKWLEHYQHVVLTHSPSHSSPSLASQHDHLPLAFRLQVLLQQRHLYVFMDLVSSPGSFDASSHGFCCWISSTSKGGGAAGSVKCQLGISHRGGHQYDSVWHLNDVDSEEHSGSAEGRARGIE